MADHPPAAADQFDAQYFERLAAAAQHWWVEGMRRIGHALLDEQRHGLAVLDAGCGSGASIDWLRPFARPRLVIGVDVAWPGLRHARRSHTDAAIGRASVTSLPLRAEQFDLAICADVLQHLTVPEARAAVAELGRVLRPGGRLLVRTNAAFGRRGVQQRDDWRLYRPQMLRAALEAAGLVVDVVTPVNAVQGLWASLRPAPQAARHGTDHAAGGGDARPEWGQAGLGIPQPVSKTKNRVLLGLLELEARWLRGGRRRLPFGHSLYAVAHRR